PAGRLRPRPDAVRAGRGVDEPLHVRQHRAGRRAGGRAPGRAARGGRPARRHERADGDGHARARPVHRRPARHGQLDRAHVAVGPGRGAEWGGGRRVELGAVGGRLVGPSGPTETGTLELDLSTDGLLVTGSWTERTSPSGYYRGAVYHGVVQFVLDPTGRSMVGRWLGPDRHFEIDSGRWELHRAG